MTKYHLQAPYLPKGDQPKAISKLIEGVNTGKKYQTLLGATGTGKTFTIANVIAQTGRPALVLAHNKTLAAQLCNELREFFPNNAVEYFISYYDYYQPEAYVPVSDTYIAKTASSGKALSIGERKAYDANRLADASMGDKYWSGRGSGRSFKQANQDTRALLIDDYGASAADVNRLSNDVLSRFRISGHLAKTDTNLQLLQDGGGSINLKLNRNSLSTPSGAVYEGSHPTKPNKTESKSNRSFLGFTRIKDDKGNPVPLSKTFSDPLE